MTPGLARCDTLVVVDVQNDFCPGGSLAVREGDRVVPVLNRWIAAALRVGAAVVASRCWHPPQHVSFRERGGPWPAHCVQHTAGAEFHPALELPREATIVSKGTDPDRDDYSALVSRDLLERLKRERRRLFVGGLALDYCVRATVLDGRRAGLEVVVILDATRAVDVNPGDGERAAGEMRAAGAVLLGE